MITLEISNSEIRLMEIEGGRVVRWASRLLEPGMFEEGVISDRQALNVAIKELTVSSGISGGPVTASVTGLYSLSRIISVPNPPGEALTHQAVLDAIREVMPVSEDEMYLSWQDITIVEGERQVLVVGLPRDVVDSEMQTLKGAGVRPRLLDLKGMALARAVNREQAIILNIEPDSFDVVMVVGGMTEIMRTTAWQSDTISVEDKAEHLAVGLELTVGFYNSHHPGFPLEPTTPLFITGQMSADLALVEELQARMEYPLEPLSPPLEYPAHLPLSQYAVNIGLALKGAALPRSSWPEGYRLPDINLLPQAYRPWRPSTRQIAIFLAVIVAIAGLFPIYQIVVSAMDETATLGARNTIINNELQRRQLELGKRQPLQMAITQYSTIVDMGGGFVEDLETITSLAEEVGTEVQSITHTGGSITFNCQADSYITFREFVTALRESGRFSSVTPPVEQPMWPPENISGGTIILTPKAGE